MPLSHFEAPSKPKLRFTLRRGAQVHNTPTNINHRHSRRVFLFVVNIYQASFSIYTDQFSEVYRCSTYPRPPDSISPGGTLLNLKTLCSEKLMRTIITQGSKYKYLVEAHGEDAGGGVVGQGQVHGAPQLLGLTAGARRRRLQQTS